MGIHILAPYILAILELVNWPSTSPRLLHTSFVSALPSLAASLSEEPLPSSADVKPGSRISQYDMGAKEDFEGDTSAHVRAWRPPRSDQRYRERSCIQIIQVDSSRA